MRLSDSVLRSAMASKLAYAKNVNMIASFPISKQLLPDKSIFDVIECSYTGAHAYVWKTGKQSCVIAFRGSHNLVDICSYIPSKQIAFSFCDRKMHIHKTLYTMFASIEPNITSILHPRQHVTFCGHSLGGAMAMFAAAYYGHLSNRNMHVSCHTFGSPKVGDANFMEWFSDYVPNCVNVRNKYDVVTYYPFNSSYAPARSIVFDKTQPITNPFYEHDLDTYIENIVNGLMHYYADLL